ARPTRERVLGRGGVRLDPRRRGARVRRTALPPRGRARDGGVTDSHAHLDACAEPDAVVARALDAGVSRIVTIGTGIESCRRALEIADGHDGVVAALGIDPHRAATPEA